MTVPYPPSYSLNDLERMLDAGESDLCECKENFTGDVRKRAREAVCAFANDLPRHNAPGVLLIGIKDDGTPSHLAITDELLRALADIKDDGNILPLPLMTVEKRTLRDVEVAVITVWPSDMPPVKYDGRIWVRTGSRRSIASEQEERLLSERRKSKLLPFDLLAVRDASLADLSRGLFEHEYLPASFAADVLAENNRTYEERLSACKFITSPDDPTPTVVGLLSIGHQPQRYLPGAAIQFLRIDGTHLSDPVSDELKAEGTIIDMLRRMDDKMAAHNRRSVDTSRGTHTIYQTYPQEAYQQILYNAVLHRLYEGTNSFVRIFWYDDRIEIMSPGGAYGNVTAESFGTPGITDYRNPNIAVVLKTYGYVQTFGRGLGIARQAMQRNHNPPPEFTVTSSMVQCTLPRGVV